jgi:transcriptional regulator NrdR family protein
MYFVDCRCPFCNSLVAGKQDVAISKSLVPYRKEMACPRCNRAIKLIENTDEEDYVLLMIKRDGGSHWYYTSKDDDA